MRRLDFIALFSVISALLSVTSFAQDTVTERPPAEGRSLRFTNKSTKAKHEPATCSTDPHSVNLLNRKPVEVNILCSKDTVQGKLHVQVKAAGRLKIKSCDAFQVKAGPKLTALKAVLDHSYNCTVKHGLPRSGYSINISTPPKIGKDILIIPSLKNKTQKFLLNI